VKLPVEGLRFECTQCGKCCTTRGEYAYVYLNDRESRDLAALLELSVADFEREYTFVDSDGWRQLTFTEARCIFLTESGQCGVYEARPTQCRTFPFWPEMIARGEWTAEGRELCEGLGNGELQPPEKILAQMRLFLDSDEES
jgi:Fe-S-cluster containining protein